MIYELRTYWAAPGKIENLHERFRSLTLRIFQRHHLEVVGFWTPVPSTPENGVRSATPKNGVRSATPKNGVRSATPESGDLVYILRFPDEESLKKAWEAFQADPEWIKGKAATEVDGKLVDKLTSAILHPTDYSPLN